MIGKEFVSHVLSIENEEEKVRVLIDFCLKRIGEITQDEALVKALKSKKVNIHTMSIQELKEVYKSKGGKNEHTSAFYQPTTKSVFTPHIKTEKDVMNFVHEYLHALSHFEENGAFKFGVMLPPANKNYKKSNLFNEGMNVKAVDMILGYPASSSYSEDRKIVDVVQAMCGLSDAEMLRRNFSEKPWITEEVKENFNPENPEAIIEFLENYTDNREMDIVESKYLPKASPKTKTRAEAVLNDMKEKERERLAQVGDDDDGWGMI